MSREAAIALGDKVSVHYTGTLDDGEVFDSSEGREPLEFVVGSGQLIPGFESAVVGMSPGEEKTVTLEAADAYGPYEEELVIDGPRSSFPPGEIRVGQSYTIQLAKGDEAEARVLRVTGDRVRMDFNHPLAGKRLTFRLRVVSVA